MKLDAVRECSSGDLVVYWLMEDSQVGLSPSFMFVLLPPASEMLRRLSIVVVSSRRMSSIVFVRFSGGFPAFGGSFESRWILTNFQGGIISQSDSNSLLQPSIQALCYP